MNTAPVPNAAADSFNFPHPLRYAATRSERGVLLGRVLENRYLIEELLDESAVSSRYVAYDMATDEAVTVELLLGRTVRDWPRIRQAVMRLAAHGHRHLAAVLGHGLFAGSSPFLVFEMYGARTLRQLLDDEGPVQLRRALRMGVQCAEALAVLHAAGVVHGRFSTEHVRVTAAGGPEAVKVDGFGLILSRTEQDRRSPTLHTSSRGLPNELYDMRHDIQSLGRVLRQLVSPTPRAALQSTASAPPRDLPWSAAARRPRDLPGCIFDKIVDRCLAEDAPRRYPSAAQLCSDLRRLEIAFAARRSQQAPAAPRARATCRTEVAATVHFPRPKSQAPQPMLPKVIVKPDL